MVRLTIDPERCRAYALGYSWQACARQFPENLHPFRQPVAGITPGRHHRKLAHPERGYAMVPLLFWDRAFDGLQPTHRPRR
jgi:hypothetical protein